MVQLLMACNDHRNGSYTGQTEKVTLRVDDDMALDLSGKKVACRLLFATLSGKPRYLRFGHLELRIGGYSTWYGNWCWDMAKVQTADAAKVANYLRKRGWKYDEAWSEMAQKWDAGTEFIAGDFAEVSSGVNIQ